MYSETICRLLFGLDPDGSVGKESACNTGDTGSVPGLGRCPGEGIGYPLQYSWASLVAQLVKNLPAMWETWVRSLGLGDPLENGKSTHSSILAWIKPGSPALQADSLPPEPQGKPKNTGVGSLSLLQWIFLIQELNWGLLHYRQILYQLSYQIKSDKIRRSVVSDSLRPHGLQHVRLPCPSPTPRAYSNSCPSSW